MLKTLTFLLCTTVVSIYAAICSRGYVKLTPGATCGPQQTMFNEGECNCCYYDTKNIPTIGIGFNLRRGDAAQVMARYNLKLADVLKDCTDSTSNYCLTDANAKDIFDTITYPEAGQCADAYVPGLPTVIRAAVIDVTFAGCPKLKKFVDMQNALKNCDWKTAANELSNSDWCKDVRANRCSSDYNCIANYNGGGCTTSTATTTTTTTTTTTPSIGCTGQTCGTFTPTCSSNDGCYCFQTSSGSSFCAEDYHCPDYPSSCDSCSPSTSVCIVNDCCGSSCVPISLGENCKNPSTGRLSKLKEPASKRSVCKQDEDCRLGTVCKRHSVGNYCV